MPWVEESGTLSRYNPRVESVAGTLRGTEKNTTDAVIVSQNNKLCTTRCFLQSLKQAHYSFQCVSVTDRCTIQRTQSRRIVDEIQQRLVLWEIRGHEPKELVTRSPCLCFMFFPKQIMQFSFKKWTLIVCKSYHGNSRLRLFRRAANASSILIVANDSVTSLLAWYEFK